MTPDDVRAASATLPVRDILGWRRRHYGERGLLESQPYSGISHALERMRQAGLRIYLATSKREAFARRVLENLKLAAYFDGIYGSVPDGRLDHKPELLAHILSKQDISALHSLTVGDRRHDIVGGACGENTWSWRALGIW